MKKNVEDLAPLFRLHSVNGILITHHSITITNISSKMSKSRNCNYYLSLRMIDLQL